MTKMLLIELLTILNHNSLEFLELFTSGGPVGFINE